VRPGLRARTAAQPQEDIRDTDAPPEDAELLRGCRAGDGAAWDALVRRYQRLVFSVALRNGLSREDAADITQITFLALLRSISRLREDESVAYWLMTVARRQSWRVRRRRERDDACVADAAPVDDPVGGWELVASVHEALQRLAPNCRNLLTALYFDPDRPSYAEVARRMGRSIGGIGPLRARCLQRMRTLLGDGGAT
jgi:RNA polymerase sigma factor (sigma-70 family)